MESHGPVGPHRTPSLEDRVGELRDDLSFVANLLLVNMREEARQGSHWRRLNEIAAKGGGPWNTSSQEQPSSQLES